MITVSDIFKDSPLPRLETEALLSHLLSKSREFLISHPETCLSPAQKKKFTNLAAQRNANYPLAYLTGQQAFYGRDFLVNQNVLVPRPETEQLVDIVLEYANSHQSPFAFVDIGTGSGIIIITLAQERKARRGAFYRRDEYLAGDISSAALKVAAANAKQHHLAAKISFQRSNLLTGISLSKLANRQLIMTANLPYLTPHQTISEPSISREPKLALEAGPDGLKYYRLLFPQLKKEKFSSLFLICEIDPGQAAAISKLARRHFPKATVAIRQDLRGQDRFLTAAI